MKTIKPIAALLLFAFLSQSCKKEAEGKTAAPAPKRFEKLEKARWLIGNCENLVDDAHFTEIWRQKNDSTFLGRSFVTMKKDTVFAESVDMVQRNDSLFYVVSAKGQNNGKPVPFYLTKAANNELVFENPKHDFPTKITYKKITDDLMLATISGIRDGRPDSDEYEYKRK